MDDGLVLPICRHRFCWKCLNHYYTNEIKESRVDLCCPQCGHPVDASVVRECTDQETFTKFLDYSLRRYLARTKNVRFCPAPDCPYAEISQDLASCPPNLFHCRRPECGGEFCYKCKGTYHSRGRCQANDLGELHQESGVIGGAVTTVTAQVQGEPDIKFKRCPQCSSLVEKIEDGSCNHMTCTCCACDFCWLCLQPAGGMHFLSPTGCTLWGQQRWSSRKKWIVRTIVWLMAPLGIFLISLILFPTVTITIPVLVGMQIYRRQFKKKWRCILATLLGVSATSILSPFIGLLVSLFIIPAGFVFVYGLMPAHLAWTSSVGLKVRMRVGELLRRRRRVTITESAGEEAV